MAPMLNIPQAGSLPADSPEESIPSDPNSAAGKTAEQELPVTEDWTCTGTLGGYEWTLHVNAEQRDRARCIIKPKPKRGTCPDEQLLADHRESVENVGFALILDIQDVIADHDEKKLEQGEDHARLEAHHWPLGNPEVPWPGITVADVADSCCDYIATCYGRAMAGRPFDILMPTSTITASEVLMATVLSFIQTYDLGTLEIKRVADSTTQEEQHD